ncbi:hypothetical protein [Paenibacillus etheri]|uniref:Uncharacterized protein n=1 Tax=Paenibacillus etheri TaxID=1306852 RepID=A0A0W1AQH2_9BACL|nr:hypothetical protein [Paenibacillus etheri]KTD83567.1 hypothetical protein UQ64_01615 [Paenibacillus etheri]
MEQLYKEILQFFLIIFNRQVRSDVLLGVHAGSQDLKKLLDEISISYNVNLSDFIDVEEMKVDLFVKKVATRL